MLNRSHPLNRYTAISGKNKKQKFGMFDFIFSVIVWTNRLPGFDEGICFLTTEKDIFTVIIVTVAKRKRWFAG